MGTFHPKSLTFLKSSLSKESKTFLVSRYLQLTPTTHTNTQQLTTTALTTTTLTTTHNNSHQQKDQMASVVRQNYHQCEAGINKQVNMELHAHYVYLSMSLYFDRDDVALPGFSKYFKKASAEEAEHAEKFMKFQNSRGGRVVLKDIPRPENDEWGSPLDAMKAAFGVGKDRQPVDHRPPRARRQQSRRQHDRLP